MRWDLFLEDWRLQFLILAIILASAVATFLTFIEIKIRKRREKKLKEEIKGTYVQYVRRRVNSGGNTYEKLSILDKIAKRFFSEAFSIPIHSDYSTLVSKFSGYKVREFEDFCSKMFQYYYSREAVTDEDVSSALSSFIDGFLKYQKLIEGEKGSKKKNLKFSSFKFLKKKKKEAPKENEKKILSPSSGLEKLRKAKEKKKLRKKSRLFLLLKRIFKRRKARAGKTANGQSKKTKKEEQGSQNLPKIPLRRERAGILNRVFMGKKLSRSEILKLERERWLEELKRSRESGDSVAGSQRWIEELRKEIGIRKSN